MPRPHKCRLIGGEPTVTLFKPAGVPHEYRENKFTQHARGECPGEHDESQHVGLDAHGPLLSALGDCCAVITRGMGPRLVADLAARGIDAYVCDTADVDEAAREFAAGRLPRLEDRGCCHH